MLLSLLLLLLMVVRGSQAAHYSGTLVTYYPKETYSNGSVSVILRFKFNVNTCQYGTFSCTGNCANESLIRIPLRIEHVNGSWCQSEKISSLLLPNNSPFQLVYDSNAWVTNKNGIGSWRAVADFELRIRSDTNKPNSSPQTTIFPALRFPSNCPRNLNLLAFDPDGDEVKCRYAKLSLTECNSPCTPPPVLSLSSTCTLSFNATSSSNEGWYAVQMVMEDFPRQAISLTQTSGSKIVKATSDRISMIPIQFAFQVDSAAPSCSEGVYLPRFLSPTPEHGTQFYTTVNQAVNINIKADATQSVISELLYSGPYKVVKSSSGSGNFLLTWTPFGSDDGQSHPICFVVQANRSNSVYQSEHRCVIVTVGNQPTNVIVPNVPLTSTKPPPGKAYLTVLKMNIPTALSLKDNPDKILKMIKDTLVEKGLPPGITLCRLSNNSAGGQRKCLPHVLKKD